jgi:Transcriptional regulator
MQEASAVSRPAEDAPRRGRPRDTNIEDKVFDAAISLYSDNGWAGFNFDAISKLSGVGKAAIYRRWATREDLLRETFALRWDPVALIDEGSLAADILAMIKLMLDRFMGTNGGIVLNLQADTRRYPEVKEVSFNLGKITAARQARIFQRAIDRGELSADVDTDLLVIALSGAVTGRIVRNNNGTMPLDQSNADEFARSLTDFLLKAAGATP